MNTTKEYRITKRALKLKYGSETPLTEKNILKFEKKYKIRIPEQFRNFLSKYNGIQVDHEHYYQIGKDKSTGFIVDSFCCLEDCKIGYNEDTFDEETGDVNPPKSLMNIAITEDGHREIYICIETGKNYGKIYYCEDREPSTVLIISNNFEEFFNGSLPKFLNEFEEVCYYNDDKSAIELINNGFKLNHKFSYRSSILELAISRTIENPNFINVVKLILDKGFPITNELLEAVRVNNFEIVKLLVNHNSQLSGSLSRACSVGNFEMVKFLFQSGCKINDIFIDEKFIYPSLVSALFSGNIDIIKFLIENGVDSNLKYENGSGNKFDQKNALEFAKILIDESKDNPTEFKKYKKCYDLLEKSNCT